MTMTSRRGFLAMAGAALPAQAEQRFAGPLGLQLYSLRREAGKDLPGALAMIRKMGFDELEAGEFFGRAPAEFRRIAAEHGLKVTSMGAEWPQLTKSTGEVAANAHAVGADFVCCTNIPHQRVFTLDDAGRAAESFNRWGETLAAAGLRFCYHPHGFEFGPGPGGTLFDTMARRIDARNANFEMDVFWIVFGRQDPVKLLERYPGRFPLMHLKDIRKGEPKTGNPGDVAEEASVPLGAGEIDWPSVLRAAVESGVRRYYLEEEHPDAATQIPRSLDYLRKLTF
jgi:sugar phosphate isomerase/epimerase